MNDIDEMTELAAGWAEVSRLALSMFRNVLINGVTDEDKAAHLHVIDVLLDRLGKSPLPEVPLRWE